MSLPATAVGEVRTTGSDSNGGFFNSARGGTDYSQQDSAQASGTASSSGTTVTATSGIFTSAMVGNYITDGTTWKEITAYTDSQNVTVDSAPSWSSASVKVGGALLTIAKAAAIVVAGNYVWIKGGTYTLSSKVPFPTPGNTTSGYIGYEGYTTTRGARDGRPIITSSTSGLTLFQGPNNYNRLTHLKFTHTGATRGSAIYPDASAGHSANDCVFDDLVFDGCYSAFLEYNNITNAKIIGCELANCTDVVVSIVSGFEMQGCYFHGNAKENIYLSYGSAIVLVQDTIFNGGTYGIRYTLNSGFSAIQIQVENCTFYNQSSNGISIAETTYSANLQVVNSIFYNMLYGITTACTVGVFANLRAYFRKNAFGSMTSGFYQNFTGGIGDVTLSGDPFTSKSTGDFSLNNTAGAGAACRAAGFPGAFPGGTTTGYLDIGAAQHQDSGGGGLMIPGGLRGGIRRAS